MHWFRRLLQKEKSESQLRDELQFHLEQQVADYIASGMTPPEARRRANLDFGGLEPTKESVRQSRRGHLIETIAQDVRFAVRMLRKNLGFTIAGTLTLALGIGANTAIFSIVNATILRPLPYKDSSRIYTISSHPAMFPTLSVGLSWMDLQQIRSQASSLEQLAAYSGGPITMTQKGDPTILEAINVSDGFFEELGATAQLGRLFTEQDQVLGQEHVAVLTDSFWRRRFAAQPSAIGQTIILDKIPYLIVGVASRDFAFPEKTELWTPLAPSPADKQNRMFFMLQVLGKLRRGERAEKLNAELDTIAQRIVKEVPALSAGYSFSAKSLLEERVGDSRKGFLILLGATTLVLLISCANLASLLLARGSGRLREMALRAALGASRARLLRQGLVESCILGLLGGSLGIVFAAAGVSLFRALAPPATPRLSEISLDSTLLWCSLVTSLISGVLFGLVPAHRAARMNPNEALKEGTGANLGAARSSRQSRLGEALVVIEVALAVVLIVGSTLMTLSLSRLLHQNLGFRSDHLLTFDLPQSPLSDSDAAASVKKQTEQFKSILELVQRIPGVSAVTGSDHGVLQGMMMMQSNLIVDGSIPSRAGETRPAGARYIFPSYFQVLGIPMVRGREFNERDSGKSQPAIIVNEAMARQYWGTLDVLGKRISYSQDDNGKPVWSEVIGVVSDSRDVRLRSRPSAGYFLSFLQGGTGSIHLLVRTLADPETLSSTISRQIWSTYPDQPVSHLSTMSQIISESLGDERMRTILLTVFAAIGFTLALVGVYGVISYSVARRNQEIGIRMALGATSPDVLRMILRQGLFPVMIGIVSGAAVALALSRLIASQFYGIQPTDPPTFLGAAAFVLIVASLACFLPARRATRIDPLAALRYE
jgi:predicted permease